MRRRSWPARLARGAALALAILALGSIAAVGLLRFVPVPLTAFMLQDDERPRQHDWVPWEEISRHAAVAVIAAEDQRFLEHDGFDFEAIDKALTDARRGRRLRGASTISQQVAKNLFLWPGQSWPRKALEAWFTLWIEALWPKRRILEVYLNSAEFGRGVWGVEAASRRYFRKPAAMLNRPEAALLAAVLPSPKRFRVSNPSAYVRQRQDWILWQMGMLERAGVKRDASLQ
ncbi:MAG TPA: monofunctional biosynthetic peptidoglycan transglycosylase [Steroidobacteraceae bacterium]|nr:monofunctional biosynthetic peptidoglycan transglycosylase [Steroidobacteraceae bacterium]